MYLHTKSHYIEDRIDPELGREAMKNGLLEKMMSTKGDNHDTNRIVVNKK